MPAQESEVIYPLPIMPNFKDLGLEAPLKGQDPDDMDSEGNGISRSEISVAQNLADLRSCKQQDHKSSAVWEQK